jgi:plasmid stabilization system protein ParE
LTACFRWNCLADQRYARTTGLTDGVKALRSRWTGASGRWRRCSRFRAESPLRTRALPTTRLASPSAAINCRIKVYRVGTDGIGVVRILHQRMYLSRHV